MLELPAAGTLPTRSDTSPSLLWARTWQKQGRIQFIRPPSGSILPVSLTQSAGDLRGFAPWAGSIAPGTAPRSPGRCVGIAPWTMGQGRRGFFGCRLIVRLLRRVRRQRQRSWIVPAGEFHQRLDPGFDRWVGREQVGKPLARVVDA